MIISPSAVATRALLDSKALVIELDIREDHAFQLALARHARYPDGDTVQNHLTPATLQKTVQALARAGISLASVQHYKPWLIANLLVGAELDKNGYQRSQAVEYALPGMINLHSHSFQRALGGRTEIEIKLPGRYRLDAALRGALKSAPGVVMLEDA